MRILLTGGSGFIGSHLCRELVDAGHTVAALSRGTSLWRMKDALDAVTLVKGDLGNLAACAQAISSFRPEAVAHLGWQGVANFDRDSPLQVKNIGWTAELFEMARDVGARVFLGLGSQAEYGPKSAVIGADDATSPTTLYGEAKLATGRIAARLANDAGMRFVWMRVFSTYGSKDHPYWMVPSLIGRLLKGERPALTAGDQLWDFLHVADAARAIRLALETDDAHGFYALGSGHAPRLRSTIETIRDEIDPRLPLGFGDVAYRPDQVMILQADTSGLTRDCGWEPRMDLRAGLAHTVAWYKSNPWIFDSVPAPP